MNRTSKQLLETDRIVLGEEGFDRVVAMLAEPPVPTEGLRELMRVDGD